MTRGVRSRCPSKPLNQRKWRLMKIKQWKFISGAPSNNQSNTTLSICSKDLSKGQSVHCMSRLNWYQLVRSHSCFSRNMSLWIKVSKIRKNLWHKTSQIQQQNKINNLKHNISAHLINKNWNQSKRKLKLKGQNQILSFSRHKLMTACLYNLHANFYWKN